jgi:hypothetical protein
MSGVSSMVPRDGERVVVAMSGGVDSSVAAALLVERGLDVVGISLRLAEERPGKSSGCCSLEDFQARRAWPVRSALRTTCSTCAKPSAAT